MRKKIKAVCKEFRGPYQNGPLYASEVMNYVSDKDVPFKQNMEIGVYFHTPFDNASNHFPSYQGVIVNRRLSVEPPYFNYTVEKGRYAYIQGNGDAKKTLPQLYGNLNEFVMQNEIHVVNVKKWIQIVSLINDEIIYELYLKTEL